MNADITQVAETKANSAGHTLLFVDDEPDIVASLNRLFRRKYSVLTATSGKEAIELLKKYRVDLIISDQRMPDMTGDQMLVQARQLQPDAVRILLTGYSDIESLVNCVNEASIYKYLTKPWEPEELKLTVTRALEHQREVFAHQQTSRILHQTVQAYERFVPKQFLHLLNIDSIIDIKLGDQTEHKMTILFSDIRNFTTLSESMTPRENFNFINAYLSRMEPVIERHRGFIDKYIGDAVMALFPTNADDAVSGAIAMLDQLVIYNNTRKKTGYSPIRIGIGLNAGVVMLGTIGGDKRMDGTVISDAVNLASRLEGMTKSYQTPLLMSEHVMYGLADATRYHIRFIDRIRVKGRATHVSVYEVFDNDEPSLMQGKQVTRDKFERALACYHMRDPQRALPLLEECLGIVPEDRVVQIYIDRCKAQHDSEMNELGSVMPWSDDFLVGMPDIDRQHRELLFGMNQVMTALKEDDCEKTLQAISLMRSQADVLFRTEEVLMQRHAYPMQQDHRCEHRTFEEYLADFSARVSDNQQDPTVLRFRAQLILLDWFANHTTKSDRHMAHNLLNMSLPVISDIETA